VTTLAISWQAKLNVRDKYCFTETYAHFGSGMPQSAQNLFAGWFNKHSNNSLALAGSVSVNHHNHMEPRSHYKQERMNQTLAVKQQRKLCQQLHLSIIYHIKLFSLISHQHASF